MTTIATGVLEGPEAGANIAMTRHDGSVRIELSELWVAPGAPDVRLYVSPRVDGRVDDTALDLGTIPDGETALARDLPTGIDATEVGSVIVYCKVYSVLFGYGIVKDRPEQIRE